jgi:type II secretory pathway pseudopilin PulG
MAAHVAVDSGESLIETLISVVILGVTASSLVMGLLTAIALSDYRREQAVVEVEARSTQQRIAALNDDDSLRAKLTHDGSRCPDPRELGTWVRDVTSGAELGLEVLGTRLEAAGAGSSLRVVTTSTCDASRPWLVRVSVTTPSAVLGGRLGAVVATATVVVAP